MNRRKFIVSASAATAVAVAVPSFALGATSAPDAMLLRDRIQALLPPGFNTFYAALVEQDGEDWFQMGYTYCDRTRHLWCSAMDIQSPETIQNIADQIVLTPILEVFEEHPDHFQIVRRCWEKAHAASMGS